MKKLIEMDPYTKKTLQNNLPFGLVAILVLVLNIVDPLPKTFQMVLTMSLSFGILAWMIYLQVRPKEDEVDLANLRYGSSVGLWIGILLAIGCVTAVRHIPGCAELIAKLARLATNGLPEAAIGFGIGVLLTVVLIAISVSMVTVARSIWISSDKE